MAISSYEIIANTARLFFNITPIEDEIVILTGDRDSSFCITDSKSKKKYVLQTKYVKDFKNRKLMDITDQIMKNAYEFSSKNEHFSTPKIIKTCEGQLSGSVKNLLGNDRGTEISMKMHEFLSGKTVSYTIDNSDAFSKLGARENLYRSLGFVCANISDFFETQSKYLNDFAMLRTDQVYTTYPKDGCISKLANLLYPDKSHPRRIIIESIFEQFTKKKQKLDALPKRLLQQTLSPELILFDSEKSHLDPNGNHDFKKLHLNIVDFQSIHCGPQCIELAILILNCIKKKNRLYHVPFATVVKIPKLIIQGFRSHPSTTEFIKSGQLELLPSVVMLMLCTFVLGIEYRELDGPPKAYIPHNVKYCWELLSSWYQCFHDNDKLIEIWSNSDS